MPPMLSQKCQYALRAVFELARRWGRGPVKVAEMAKAQAIPPRFLEVIMGQLKQGRFVVSQRGAAGGYELVRPPAEVTVGEIIRFVEGPLGPVACVTQPEQADCPLRGRCVFLPMWQRAHQAVAEVYDTTTFQDLLDQERRLGEEYVPCYAI